MYKFYLQRADIPSQPKLDLEKHFKGLIYKSCKGLNTKGKRKDILVEKYVDSDEDRVWQGDNVCRESTKIELELYFVGTGRENVYESFYEYIKNGKFYYYDTARHRKAYLVFSKELEPDEEVFVGSNPYMLTSFEFNNIWGECKPCNDDGILV